MTDLAHIEERMAHMQRMMEDLSDTVARQDQEITRLSARVEMLMRREAERESEGGGGVVIGDERPPHY
ncbi:MAG: SlyX family protein [Pelagimonas sp.]|jgi:SlyX protein|nr:SlyX family protein [Pelagimonas sp.]